MNNYWLHIGFLGILFLLFSCEEADQERLQFSDQGNDVPQFNADSAYHYIEEQLAFGPRNPNSKGHQQAKQYYLDTFRKYAGSQSVFLQEFTEKGYDGDTLNLTNVIAAFNPHRTERIMLCAHWDTRPRADKAETKQDQPILGADDGASGVGVLIELARLFEKHPPPIGVDIVLFDGEDYGKEGDMSKYFLGSRYWSNNPPVKGYSPRFGILLDMVGAKGAQFPKEGYSMQYAPALVNEIWAIADEKGYDELFISERGDKISDDHIVINRIAGIPIIDIIHYKNNSSDSQFASYWHTHDDDLSIISKETLQGVGETVTELIYNRLNTND